jgi:hypothetical protein
MGVAGRDLNSIVRVRPAPSSIRHRSKNVDFRMRDETPEFAYDV